MSGRDIGRQLRKDKMGTAVDLFIPEFGSSLPRRGKLEQVHVAAALGNAWDLYLPISDLKRVMKILVHPNEVLSVLLNTSRSRDLNKSKCYATLANLL